MNVYRILVAAGILVAVGLVAASEAEAGRGWRKARWSNGRSHTRTITTRRAASTSTGQAWSNSLRPSTGPVTYSGVSRAEQDYWRRRDAWYDHAYNGWRPEDFR